VSGNLPSDFGFVISCHPHEPETIYVIPITSDYEHYPPGARLAVYRSRTAGNEWELRQFAVGPSHRPWVAG
jgi:hypothetical protein